MMRRYVATVFTLVMLGLSACAHGVARTAASCGADAAEIDVRLLTGPACPGPQRAAGHCSPKPLVRARVALLNVNGGKTISVGISDREGRIAFHLCPSGLERFRIRPLPVDGQDFPRPPRERTVTLRGGQSKSIQLIYDSGMR